MKAIKINFMELFTCLMMFCIPIEPLLGIGYTILLYLYIGLSIIFVFLHKKVKLTLFEFIYIFFILLCIASIFYSGQKTSSTSMTRQIIVNILLAFSISQVLINRKDDEEKVNWFIKIFNWFTFGTVFVTIYLVIFELPELNKWDRFGQELYKNYGTYIVYSYCLIISTCFQIWKVFFSNTEKKIKGIVNINIMHVIDLIILLVLIYADFISGTRKCLICPILFTIFYIFIKYRKKYIKLFVGIIIIIILSIIGYKVIMSNETFYYSIGRRIESMVDQFTGKEETDGSMEERDLLRNLSIELFKEHPIAGYGIHAFRLYSLRHGGPYLYAHCNYTELLADLGILGFVFYYGAYLSIVIVALKNQKKKKLSIFILSFMLMNLISDYSSVTYFRHYYLIVFVVFARYLTTDLEENKNEVK